MQGKSVACTLLQLFNKVSIIVQVPTAPVSGTSSSWAVERTIVVCVLEKLMFIRFLLLKIWKWKENEYGAGYCNSKVYGDGQGCVLVILALAKGYLDSYPGTV